MKKHLLAIVTLLVWQAIFTCQVQAQGKSKKTKQTNADSMWVTKDVAGLPTNVTHHTFHSKSMNREVGYCLYLPPSYASKADRRYPVIYHLHGAGGNETRSVYSAEVLHQGILEKRWPEMIIVFPNGGRSTMYQDSGNGQFMAETMMMRELIPHIDATYRTHAMRGGRCIEGFSMGGRGSTHLAMKHPDVFCSLFNQSGNVYHVSDASQLPNPYLGDNPEHLRANDPYLNLAKNLDYIKKNLRIRMGCGTNDPEHLKTVREFHAALTQAGVEHEYFEVEGLDHNQRQMIQGLLDSWFSFHVQSLKLNGAPLVWHE